MNLINESTTALASSSSATAATNSSILNFYEQLLMQRNLSAFQQQQQQQQQHHQSNLSLLASPNQMQQQTSSSASSISSSKSQQSSPSSQIDSSDSAISSTSNNNDNDLLSCPSTPILPSKTPNQNDFESKYKAYMMNAAAAAAAAAASFPYSMFGHLSQQSNLMVPPPPPPPPPPILPSHLGLSIHASLPAHSLNMPNNNHQFLVDNFQGLFAAAAAANAQKINMTKNSSQNLFNANNTAKQNGQNFNHNENNLSKNKDNNDQEDDLESDDLNSGISSYRSMMKNEEPKPAHSYIGLIALAILSSPEKRLVLSDIYQWILDNYSYFHTRGSGWRNSIRHNLSLNDCFMKAGRSSNGKGHYWTIHPANLEDFSRGDFRRRRAQRRVRKSLGLTVPEEDEEDDDLLTPPSSLSPVLSKIYHNSQHTNNLSSNSSCSSANSLNENNIDLKRNYDFLNPNLPLKRPYIPTREDDPRKHMKYDQINENYLNQLNLLASIKEQQKFLINLNNSQYQNNPLLKDNNESLNLQQNDINNNSKLEDIDSNIKKRSFNVDSLLAPENKNIKDKKLKVAKDDVNNNEEDEIDESLEESLNDSSSIINDQNSTNNLDSSNEKHDKMLTINEKIEDEIKKNVSNIDANDNKRLDSKSTNFTLSKHHSSPSKRHSNLKQINFNHNYQQGYNATMLSEQNSPFSKIESNNEDVEKWKQTFSKIMARSYKNNNNNNHHHHHHNHQHHKK